MQEDKNAIFQMRFPQKLWYMLNLRPDAILWGGTGRTILLNYRVLKNYLQCDHSVFKTTNISSFVRQLNLYGFRKVTSHLQDPLCNSSNPFMHEYVHDYFQYGRPELLNKITRKALTIKRNFKSKNGFNNIEQLLCLTPLQKARHAFQVALKNAAQELCLQENSKHLGNIQFECEDSQDDLCEDDEHFEFDWMPSKAEDLTTNSTLKPAIDNKEEIVSPRNDKNEVPSQVLEVKVEELNPFGNQSQDSLAFSSQQNNESFTSSFLSMPDLDSVTPITKSEVELLAEFNIDNDMDEGIARKMQDHSTLNCVLPSINHDQNDDVSISENNGHMDHYNGEWDQMFNDMINKDSNQECGSELKQLYSQISKTIDLLNS